MCFGQAMKWTDENGVFFDKVALSHNYPSRINQAVVVDWGLRNRVLRHSPDRSILQPNKCHHWMILSSYQLQGALCQRLCSNSKEIPTLSSEKYSCLWREGANNLASAKTPAPTQPEEKPAISFQLETDAWAEGCLLGLSVRDRTTEPMAALVKSHWACGPRSSWLPDMLLVPSQPERGLSVTAHFDPSLWTLSSAGCIISACLSWQGDCLSLDDKLAGVPKSSQTGHLPLGMPAELGSTPESGATLQDMTKYL